MKPVMLAALLIASSAHATYFSTPAPNTTPSVIANGGAGGSVVNINTPHVEQRQIANGGAGGSVMNINTPHVEQRQQQKQRQRQRQRQQQSLKDSGNSNNTNTSQSNNTNTSQSNNTNNVTLQAGQKRPVSTAYAPSVPPTTVCAGSTQGGAQGAAFGVSFGSSWTDANCMLLEQVRTVAVVLNDNVTASEMMCAVDAYREARIRAGNPCKQASPTAANPKQQQYTDPIIRARLGLPPL